MWQYVLLHRKYIRVRVVECTIQSLMHHGRYLGQAGKIFYGSLLAASLIIGTLLCRQSVAGDRYCVTGATIIELQPHSTTSRDETITYAHIWSIDQDNPRVDESTLAILCGLGRYGHLKEIDFFEATFSDKALKQLSRLPAMEELHFSSCAVDDDAVLRLKCKRLRVLSLFGTKITDAALVRIGTAKKLELLDLGNTSITCDGLGELERLPSLIHLSLAWTPVNDSQLRYLRTLDRLEVLNLTDTDIGDRGIRNLIPLQSLKVLKLNGTQVSDESIRFLSQLRELERLEIAGTQVTEAGYDKLSKKMPKLLIYPSLDGLMKMRPPTAAARDKTGYPRPEIQHGRSLPSHLFAPEEQEAVLIPRPFTTDVKDDQAPHDGDSNR